MSLVGALRRRSGTGREPSSRDERARRVVRRVDGVALRRARRDRARTARARARLRAIPRRSYVRRRRAPAQRARVGEADVLARHADQPPPDVERIGAAVEHAAHPVERRVGIRSAHRLVQRRDLVVERLAALVEAAQAPRDRRFDERDVDRRSLRLAGGRRELLDEVEQPPPVAVGVADQRIARRVVDRRRRASPRATARSSSCASSGADSGSSTYTAARDSSALFTSNDGFSVVAPMNVSKPCSTNGRNASCCALLKRCTSSTNRIVARPYCSRASSARATASRMSLTPASTAEIAMNSALNASAMRRASVVLPTPGGPHRIIECGLPEANATAQRLARREQMPLADHLVDRFRPQPLGERRQRPAVMAVAQTGRLATKIRVLTSDF